jgi:hypothetical protein
MKKTLTILKNIWKCWCYFCGGLGMVMLGIVLLATVKQSDKDQAFTKESLIPLASYVEGFRNSKGRLPTEEEFNSWAETNFENKAVWYYTNKPPFMKNWGTPGKDFVVGAWRGEWTQYYSSWDKKDFSE